MFAVTVCKCVLVLFFEGVLVKMYHTSEAVQEFFVTYRLKDRFTSIKSVLEQHSHTPVYVEAVFVRCIIYLAHLEIRQSS